MKRHRVLAVVGIVAFVLVGLVTGQVNPVIVGVLEDNPGIYAGQPHYRDVRVVFRYDQSGWTAFPGHCPDQRCLREIAANFPAQVRWTVEFDGRDFGQVAGRTPLSFEFYSTVGQQEIVGSMRPPTVGKPSEDFAGFLGEPVYRPLIAVSEPNYRDPEEWRPTTLAPSVLGAVRKAFRDRFPDVKNCTKQDYEHPKPWHYLNSDIKLGKAYASNRHWVIAEVMLSGYECDGIYEEPFTPQWFVMTPERQVRFLDSNMWLVDAGDYDNDSKSELVFAIDDYNRGGYKLFYDDFKQKRVFEFSYH